MSTRAWRNTLFVMAAFYAFCGGLFFGVYGLFFDEVTPIGLASLLFLLAALAFWCVEFAEQEEVSAEEIAEQEAVEWGDVEWK